MKTLLRNNTIICLAVSLLVVTACEQSQPKEPDPVRRKSPIAIAKVTDSTTNTYVKIVYGQPYKRERAIFGDLVPYGEVWRTGANEATELTTTNNIMFAGKQLEAGTYTFFSIPREKEPWTIILNDVLGQWGAFDYEQEHDVLRADAPARQKDNTTEAFTIQFSEITDDSTNIIMKWDQTVVKIPVEFIDNSTISS